VLFVTSRATRPRAEVDMVRSFAANPSITVREVDDPNYTLPALGDFDAVVFFVKFRQLRLADSIAWRGYDGLRVLMDHDAFMDYTTWSYFFGTTYRGEWTQHIRRLGFDLAVVSGTATAEHLARQGLDAEVVHKAVATNQFFDARAVRSGIGHYGSPYRSRAAMLRRMAKQGIAIKQISSPYLELNSALNALQSVIVCNMGASVRFGKMGRAIERIRPGDALVIHPAPEPMLKNFEAAAAGCATFMDDVADLQELGFVDGQNAIIYRDFDDLRDRLVHYAERVDKLESIGSAGALLCSERHSWDHRAALLLNLLNRRLS
jgi:hypothetical protein